MSLAQARLSSPAQDAANTAWAPEINDLQKYRDSLKIMAERVSQAEHIWAKSLEPQNVGPSHPPSPRHSRKMSKSKKPKSLERPLITKRIRTDETVFSPDPFQLLSPSALSDNSLSPTSSFSAQRSPYRRGRQLKRAVEESSDEEAASSSSDTHMAGAKAQELLKDAEDLLRDALRLLKTDSQARKSEEQLDIATEADGPVRLSKTRRQVRHTCVQVQALVADARRHSNMVPSDDVLFQRPLREDDSSESSTDIEEQLVNLSARLRSWINALSKVRKRLMTGSVRDSPEDT